MNAAKATTTGMRQTVLAEAITPLHPYLDDSDITEVAINQPGEIWTEGRNGWTRYEAPTFTHKRCAELAKMIATHNNKKIDDNTPVLSATLPTGERVQIIMPPACTPGTVSITVRKPSRIDKTLEELHKEGAFDEYSETEEGLQEFEKELLRLKGEKRIHEFLDMAVRRRRNILIVGKTGSGKTTITKSLIRSIPSDERLITIEDVHELFLNQHPNKVHLFYAREDEGGAKVTAKQALAACLRMKPDRILLAEMRGDEAWEFIKSVNTGHPGSISTMHANGALEAFDQLTALIKDSRTGAHLDAHYIKDRLFATLDVILFYDKRKLREIYYDPERKLAVG